MRRYILLILFWPLLLRGNWEHFFPGQENPALFHHVDVITGHLNLQVTDTIVHGAVSIPMTRSYSSSSALDRYFNDSVDLAFFKDGRVQGGWSVLPSVILRIDSFENGKICDMFATDPNGNRIKYTFSHFDPDHKHVAFLKTSDPFYQISGNLGGRNNPTNSTIRLDLKLGEAVLLLPNGGSRTYRGIPLRKFKGGKTHYLLYDELLPSQHKLTYKYGSNLRLEEILCTNISGTKTFSWVKFKTPAFKKYFIRAETSDQKAIQYDYKKHGDKQYLNSSNNPQGKYDTTEFIPGRVGTGHRIGGVSWAGKNQFRVQYQLPPPELESIWALFPDQVDSNTDKVRRLEAPVGPNDEMLPIASFSYFSDHTEVRDVENLLIRYEFESILKQPQKLVSASVGQPLNSAPPPSLNFSSLAASASAEPGLIQGASLADCQLLKSFEYNRLKQIHYFDKNDQPYSSQKFYWNGCFLSCKAMLDRENKPIFAKTFAFDARGNVENEVFWGQLTGLDTDLVINEKGETSGAESYTKKYSYYPESNLLAVEQQEDGPTIRYFYRFKSDCLEKKFTCDGPKILIREFYEYDDDWLLITEIVDDGSTEELAGPFTHRMIKRYERDSITGLVKSTTESYWDLESAKEQQLKKTVYTYNSSNLVETEAVFDAKNLLRYTLRTKYDPHGNIISKTTPLGFENTYLYDECDQLIEIKEVGSPKRIFTYDAAGRQKTCEEPSLNRCTTYLYDAKGKLLSTTESNGNTIEQIYDSFGRCKQTRFSQAKDEKGEIYTPVFNFDYDIQGNLASVTTPRGETTFTFYNAIGKPVRIIEADGKETSHLYNTNGTLAKTTFPDKTEVVYSYDIFQRKISEEKFSGSGDLLTKETWVYKSFHLDSYTDHKGLTTTFKYDGAGRKISERMAEREIFYSYDDLGFLEKTTQGGNSKIQKHNCAGLIEETWEEDSSGRKENHTRFFFDHEQRKQKAIRVTSKGEATDQFSYFDDGRLKTHIDPDGNVNRFEYNYFFKNDLGQYVLQKTSIDPSGNVTLDTYDANNRLVLREKKSPEGITVFREELFYDRSGNRAKLESTIYADRKSPKKTTTTWEYDEMGRVRKQTEGGRKSTTYTYDDRGRLYQKTLPRGVVLTSIYDGVDRLTHLFSSDGSIQYEYADFLGHNPTRIIDHVQKTLIERSYNLFGELTQETHSATGISTKWSYDILGRCKTFTLPDLSSIGYDYQGLHLSTVTRYSPEGRPLYHHSYTSFDLLGHPSEEEPIFKMGTIHTERDLLERPSLQTSPWLTHSVSYNKQGLVSEINNSLFGNKLCTYDPLGQLNQEGEQRHRFDSLGNSLDFETDECNQIIGEAYGFTLRYDLDGNPIERIYPDKKITLEYDPLGRLVEINYINQRKICYSYDPFSRLLAKEVFLYWKDQWIKDKKSYFLYDQDKEIGLLPEGKKILQLKVLGLGLKGDIGAAVALEIENKVYAPLHDFSGNIIALVSSGGKIAESYHFDAFGRETNPIRPLNPWRFASKRHDEGLVFFGLRFYDRTLKRWLTPDPAGFADGANLYAYVLNSPFNRLDLFGLASENFLIDLRIEIPITTFYSMTTITPVKCQGAIQGVPTNFIVACGYFHQLRYSPVEELTGKINLADHFAELMPNTSSCIGLCTVTKGINTTFEEFETMCRSDIAKRKELTLFISPYFPTQGLKKDYEQLKLDIARVETSEAKLTRQFMIGIIERMHKVNPKILWDLCSHSRGALLAIRSIEDMTDEQKELVKDHLCFSGIGGVEPMKRKFAYDVSNIYSTKDRAVKKYVKPFLDHSDYDITHIACRSPRSEWSMYYADHAFMGSTYQFGRRERIKDVRGQFGYYTGAAR